MTRSVTIVNYSTLAHLYPKQCINLTEQILIFVLLRLHITFNFRCSTFGKYEFCFLWGVNWQSRMRGWFFVPVILWSSQLYLF